MIVGGEVDCVLSPPPSTSPPRLSPSQFVELKTNLVIQSERDEIKFEKFKLLKFYMQSFLLGVENIFVGFRTREGTLKTVQRFKTLELPRL